MNQQEKTNTNQLLLTGRYCLPKAEQASLIEHGGIVIEGETIVDIGPASELSKKYPHAEQFDEPGGLIMPGLINTHTHAPMSCFRGFADDLPLMTWLQEHIFPVETELTGEIVYHATLLSIAEMIKTGTTSFCDMYLFAKDVAKAVDQAGIRSWLGEAIYDFPSPNFGELENGFVYMDEIFEQYDDHQRITITTDPHSVYTCSPELLQRVGNYAREKETLFVIHLAENDAEVSTCMEQHGARPVVHLDKLGLLEDNMLAAHCVRLDDNDISLLRDRQVKVTHCAESNLKLASGIAPIPELLDAGVTVSIGTDGSASNNDVDMFSEMNSVALIHKGRTLDPTVVSAEQTLHAATLGGAKALHADKHIGTLEIGKQADCIVLDLDQPHLAPIYNIPSHLVYVARGSDVIHSMVGGHWLMKDRLLLSLDEKAILTEMQAISQEMTSIRQRSKVK